MLADVLLRTGDTNTAGHYAAASFSRNRSPASAHRGGSSGGGDGRSRHGDQLAARGRRGLPSGQAVNVADAIDHAPELAVLRDDPELRRLRAALTSA